MTDIPAMYPGWVFGLYAVASAGVLLAALASVAAAAARRWALTRRLGCLGFIGGITIFVVATLMVVVPPMLGLDLGAGSASRASRIGKTISELMNTTVIAFPGALIGAVTWPLGAIALRRRG